MTQRSRCPLKDLYANRTNGRGRFLHVTAILVGVLLLASPILAAGGNWTAQGPGPTQFGQIENVIPNNEVVGAIHAMAPHPTNADILYAGGTNGGIWLTENATDLFPTWEQQTDKLISLSIGALAFDPTDSKNKTLVAGLGLFSSFGRTGGPRAGLLVTKNRGNKWKVVDGGGTLVDKNISGVAPRGDTIVVSIDFATVFSLANIGIWRTTDGGATFSQIAIGDGSSTGLPSGVTHDLVGDPSSQARLFTSVVFADLVGGANGVYRSDNTGAAWTKVSDAAMDALLISGVTSNVEFAVGNHNNVYAAIANSGRLAGLFRSGNGGATWTALDLPSTVEDGFSIGIHPGGQASIHLSIAADPGNANVVYIGGDRQPFFGEASGGPGFFPNSIGAANFSGRQFRVDASQPAGSQAAHLTHSNALGAPGGGTTSNSSPHADSREMAFDAAGNLLESDDGGIYRRTSPANNTGDWFSLNGDIQTNELHDASYDNFSDVIIGGTQDNGTDVQGLPDDVVWSLLLSGDGGDVAVDETSTPGISIRYSSAQGLQAFNRTFWNAANNFVGFVFPALTVLDGGAGLVGQFTTPVELNAVDPTRLIIGGANSVYESLDQGDTIREIGPGIQANGNGRDAVAYGGAGNADILYIGSGTAMFVRTGPHPAPLVQSLSFPGTPFIFTVRDIVLDPDDANTAFVITTNSAYLTTDAGATWSDITDDLVDDALTPLRSITYMAGVDGDDIADGGSGDVLAVGSSSGVHFARESKGFGKWKQLGNKLPTVVVFDLDYDPTDNVLVAGTLGRGAWKLAPFVD